MKIRKSDLIQRLAHSADHPDKNLSEKQKRMVAKATVNLFFETIKKSLVKSGRMEIRGFGSFTVKHYQAYSGRNPRTGQVVEVKSRKGVSFRPSKILKQQVNTLTSGKHRL